MGDHIAIFDFQFVQDLNDVQFLVTYIHFKFQNLT